MRLFPRPKSCIRQEPSIESLDRNLLLKYLCQNWNVTGTASLELYMRMWSVLTYVLDAVGSWQIILPMPNYGRPYQSDKGSEAILRC